MTEPTEDLRTDWQKQNPWRDRQLDEDGRVADPGGGYRENGRYYGTRGGPESVPVFCSKCGDLITCETYEDEDGLIKSRYSEDDCNRCHPKTPLGGLAYR